MGFLEFVMKEEASGPRVVSRKVGRITWPTSLAG
jgi:hypothetical protein